MSAIITFRGLTKTYGEQRVVDNIDLDIHAGEFCGILGPNGAGKTTTLRMLLGHTAPSAGELVAFGCKIPEQASAMRNLIGVVPQHDNLDPDFSVVENLRIYGSYFGIPRRVLHHRIPKLLKFAALSHKADALVTSLSGGMQRRVSLARALIQEPRLLVLDEPATGLDPQARQVMWQRLRHLKCMGLSVILTTHYMDEAERLCDRIVVMDHGRVLADSSPQELISDHIEPQVMEVHGPAVHSWHYKHAAHLPLRCEHVGDSRFYYGNDMHGLLQALEYSQEVYYLHRLANLEDVFLKLTGRELRDE